MHIFHLNTNLNNPRPQNTQKWGQGLVELLLSQRSLFFSTPFPKFICLTFLRLMRADENVL